MTETTTSSQIIKEFYRKTKLIQKNDIKTIWQATHIYTGDVVIAKLQTINENINQRTVLHQGKFLQSCQGSPGIPFLVWCGKDQIQKQAVLIQEKLGKTLKHIVADNINGKLSLKSVVMIGIQLIKVISCYHQKGYIHRNISLDTIQFGTGSRCDQVYFNDLIDSRSFYKKGTLQHIDRKSGFKPKKANEFTSFDTLDGVEPSRKDDLQSIMLVLICLLKGKLPWSEVWANPNSGINPKNVKTHYSQKKEYIRQKSEEKLAIISKREGNLSQQDLTHVQGSRSKIPSLKSCSKTKDQCEGSQQHKYHKQQQNENIDIHDKVSQLLNDPLLPSWKIDKRIQATKSLMSFFPPSTLCSNLPRQLLTIYSDIKSLQFTSKPDYLSYIQRLQAILIKNNLQNDHMYDWMGHKSLSQSVSKGGLSVKEYEWLIRGEDKKSKLVQFDNQEDVLAVYEKLAPYIEIDRLGGL